MHELILFACVISRGLVTGIYAAKNTNCINVGTFILDLLGAVDSIIGNFVLESVPTRGRAIGEEDNDLLGISTPRRNALGQLQAIVGVRGTGRRNGIDCFLEALCTITRARRQLLHCLRVVVGVEAFAILIITDLIALLACKFNDGNLMLLVFILDLLVLLGDGTDEAVGGILERNDTLDGTSIAHRVIHRTRSV